MPYKPKTPCRFPGCPEMATKDGYCDKHRREIKRRYDKDRPSAARRGYNYRWQKIRKMFLAENPLCHDCLERGEVKAAEEVHHIKPLAEGGTHEFSNLMSLCKECHSKRTMKESVR